MKLAGTLILAALIGVPTFAPTANARQASQSREEIIRECVAMNKRYPHDSYSPLGGVQYMYQACMEDHGQPE